MIDVNEASDIADISTKTRQEHTFDRIFAKINISATVSKKVFNQLTRFERGLPDCLGIHQYRREQGPVNENKFSN